VTEGRVAHLMYEWRGQPLSVYVLPSPIGRAVETRTFVRRFGHEAVVWSQRGRTYVVLARGKREELDGVVSYVRANAR
jgi:anti-sigma factor RsiW